ncbi:MAG: GumC family protein, partial [Mesorhizobium sp.]|nr:GumC family protein [Mesorhizobium sp.]
MLSLGRAPVRTEENTRQKSKAASLLSTQTAVQSAAERHRLARSRREATPNRLLAALASRPLSEPAESSAGRAPDDTTRLEPTNREYPAMPTDTPVAAPAPKPAYDDDDYVEPAAARDDGNWRPLIDPLAIVRGIVRSRGIILAATVAGALIGVAIAISTPKKYESVAELLVDPRDLKIVDREITSSGLPSDATLAIVENQVRVLTSGNVLEKVVDKLNLAADPEFNGQASGFGIRSIVDEIRSILSRDEKGEGDVRRALAIQNLGESLSVERTGKTFVVSVGATTEDAKKSALIANTLTEVFLQTYGDIQSGSAGRASDELTSRLVELQTSLEAAERKVEAYKAENDIADAGGRLISDDEMVKLNDQLSIARARTIELNARAASARNLDLNAVVGGELPEQIASPVMAELRSQYAVSKQEVERLSVRLGPRHPERLAAEAQLAGARDSMASELRRITSSIQIELKRAVQLEQDLASRLAQIKARQSGVSEDLVTLRELEREAAAKRAVYESFLLRARETGEQRGMNTANMSVISIAQPPLEALGPSRSMI